MRYGGVVVGDGMADSFLARGIDQSTSADIVPRFLPAPQIQWPVFPNPMGNLQFQGPYHGGFSHRDWALWGSLAGSFEFFHAWLMNFKNLQLREADGGCSISLKVIPKSSRNQVAGVEGGVLKIKIQAPPVEGAANEAVIKFLSGLFHQPKSSILVIKGQQSRHKVIRIKGAQVKEILESLAKYQD